LLAMMNLKAVIEAHAPGQVLTQHDVVSLNGQPVLSLSAEDRTATLPLKNINAGRDDAPPVWIAWFDPLVPQVAEVGVALMAPYISLLQPDLTLQPASSKSEQMIRTAVERAGEQLGREIPLETALGDTDEDTVRAALRDAGVAADDLADWYVPYQPITGRTKYLAILPETAARVVETVTQGGRLVVLDDIYSSGATTHAAREVIRRALARAGRDVAPKQIPVVAVAQEVEGGYDDAQRQDANLLSAAVIPVIVGPLTL